MNATAKKSIKITAIVLLCIVLAMILVVGSYLLYVVLQYYRLPDKQELAVKNAITRDLATGEDYVITTYNIGFGAYSQDFSFFMDSGEMKDGAKKQGSGSKAVNKAEAVKNTNGAISVTREQNADFMLFQEVDVQSDRARKVNQKQMIEDAFPEYSSTFAVNFHSTYLMYPLFDHHGATTAGISTLSKYTIENSLRRSLPIDDSFPTRFFDLDRCFSVNTIPVNNGKKLTLINLHMSAYDEGGLIRKKQLEMLNATLEENKENYVVMGGDFNHDISLAENTFPTEQKVPEWVFTLDNSSLASGYHFASATNAPTCRSTDMAYTKGVNFTAVIDGYVVSDNITVVSNTNIDNDFLFSDHQLAKMTFRLN